MPITTLPPVPSRSNPSNFSDKADAFLGALPTFATEANTLEANVNSKESTATTAANTATTAANTATTKAGEASASATTAQNWATSLSVVSGGLYGARYYAQQAANAVGSFKGSRDSDPPTAVTGDWYISTVSGLIRAYSSTAGWVNSVSVDAGVETVNGMTGNVVLDVLSTARVFYMSGV